jgi:hypothetical protein
MQKFSIGLSGHMDIEEYRRIFLAYGEHIDYLYFSVPGGQFQTRNVYSNKINISEYLCSILLLAQNNFNVKLELVLNTWFLEYRDIVEAYQWLILNNIKIDAIVTLQEYLPIVRKIFPDVYLLNSCNDLVRTKQAIDKLSREFSEVVCGTGAIKNPYLWRYMQTKGVKVKIFLNSGCSFGCRGCLDSEYCIALNERNIYKYGAEFMYAIQSITPHEFNIYYKDNKFINGFKLSTRTREYAYINACLDSYINDKEMFYIYKSTNNYFLWDTFAGFVPYARYFNPVNLQKYKNSYWQKILPKFNKL